MTRDFSAIDGVRDESAIYVLYSGGKRRYVAYVGVAGQHRSRLKQHFFSRDSSVTTGAAAVSLVPDKVCALAWWQHDRFGYRDALEAAEEIAFRVFEPTLRSRGGTRSGAQELLADDVFSDEIRDLLEQSQHGELAFPSVADLHAALESLVAEVADLRTRLEDLDAEKR